MQKGRTKFRERPISGRRFLIGAGRQCDLRLGGDAVPELHSVIHRSSSGVWIDAFADSPRLRVNGRDVVLARLQDGDTLEIGEFGLVVRLKAGDQTLDVEAPAVQAEIPADSAIGHLTASELVDLIENETQIVSEFEGRRQLGAAALLQAVGNHLVKGRHAIPLPTRSMCPDNEVTEQSLLGDLERVLLQLHTFSQKLEGRSHQLLVREATQANAATSLLDAQRQLSAHVDKVLQRIDTEQQREEPPARASA